MAPWTSFQWIPSMELRVFSTSLARLRTRELLQPQPKALQSTPKHKTDAISAYFFRLAIVPSTSAFQLW